MKSRSIYNYCLGTLALFLAVLFFMGNAGTTSAATCIKLNADLGYGSADDSANGHVFILQTYLQSLGYLVATPNGHFGQATLSAVKTFQKTNGISSTGYVGMLTRAMISQKTCTTGAPATSPTIPATQLSNTTPTPVYVPPNTNVTSPATGQVLSVGSSTVIRWNNSPLNMYDISLEQPGGAGAGFIALSQSPNTGKNQYVWSVGKIYNSQSSTYQTLSPGTYRIRLQSSVGGASTSDQTSGWFTVVAQQFVVNSVAPSSAYADNATSVVLLGTGFSNASVVYFGSNNSGSRANNEYVSPDGTVLVFTIPTNVSAGANTLYINNNGYNSSPITMPFTVLSSQ